MEINTTQLSHPGLTFPQGEGNGAGSPATPLIPRYSRLSKIGDDFRNGFLKIAQTKIYNRLGVTRGDRPSSGYAGISALSPVDITAGVLQSVASSIAGAHHLGSDGNELMHMIDQAQKNIDRGLDETMELFAGAGEQGSVQSEMDRLRTALKKGMDQLSASLSVLEPRLQGDPDIEKTRSLSIQLVTREGDMIDVGLNQSISRHSKLEIQYSGSGLEFGLKIKESVHSSLAYNVNGSLNDQEQLVLDQVLKGVDEIARDFLAGKWSHGAVGFDYDTKQLQSYKLSSSERSNHANAKLEAWGDYDVDEDFKTDQLNKLLAHGDVQAAGRLRKLLDAVEELFDNPGDVFMALLKGHLQTIPDRSGKTGIDKTVADTVEPLSVLGENQAQEPAPVKF